MVIGMDGKRVKLQKPYDTEQVVELFRKHCFYLYDVKMVDQGTLVDLFGPIVIEILDIMRNSDSIKHGAKSEYPYCGRYGCDLVTRVTDSAGFRAVNMAGFGHVVSIINERIVCENYAYTGGAIVSKVFAEREEEEKRKKEEARSKRAAKAAAKKAAEG